MLYKFKKRYSLLIEYIYNRTILGYILLYSLILIIATTEPYFAGKVLNFSIYEFNSNLIVRWSFIWLTAFVTRLAFDYKKSILDIKYDIKIKKCIQIKLLTKILKIKYHEYNKQSDGYWMSRCCDDVYNLDSFMPKVVIGGVLSFVQFILILIIMMRINVILTIFSMIFLIGDAVANFLLPLTKYYKDYSQKRVKISHELNDILRNFQLIKSNTIQNKEVGRFSEILNEVYLSLFTRDKMNYFRNLGRNFVSGVSTPILYLFGGIFIVKGKIGLDTFISFMMYFGLLMASFTPISTLYIRIRNANVYMDRISEIMNIQEEVKVLDYPLKHIQKIEFKNVILIHKNKTILDGISVTLNKKDKIAIFGDSGSGKTSFVRLLLGFNDISSGQILINDCDYSSYDINEIRAKIGYIDQDGQLFNRSVFENLNLSGDCNINIDEYLEIVQSKDFVYNNKRDLTTIIDSHGSNYSGGEKQRLTIARELIKGSDVYIFDEPTSALDNNTENIIFKNIMYYLAEKTVLFITHNPELVRKFDKILFIERGKIIAIGSHNELMESFPSYKNLYDMYKQIK